MRQAYDVADQRTGHIATVNLWRHHVKKDTGAGMRGRLTWEPIDPNTRAGMRKLFHGFILKDFADHTGYSVEAWKRWLTDQFCPPQFDAAGNEVAQKSTEAMNDEQYARFLLEVQAFGVLDVGLEFTEQEP